MSPAISAGCPGSTSSTGRPPVPRSARTRPHSVPTTMGCPTCRGTRRQEHAQWLGVGSGAASAAPPALPVPLHLPSLPCTMQHATQGPHLERAALDNHSRHGALPLVNFGLNHNRLRAPSAAGLRAGKQAQHWRLAWEACAAGKQQRGTMGLHDPGRKGAAALQQPCHSSVQQQPSPAAPSARPAAAGPPPAPAGPGPWGRPPPQPAATQSRGSKPWYVSLPAAAMQAQLKLELQKPGLAAQNSKRSSAALKGRPPGHGDPAAPPLTCTLPPTSSSSSPAATSCCRTLAGLARSVSHWVTATTRGPPAARAWEMASRVCRGGMGRDRARGSGLGLGLGQEWARWHGKRHERCMRHKAW